MLRRTLLFFALVAPAFGQYLTWNAPSSATSGTSYSVDAQVNNLNNPFITLYKNGAYFSSSYYITGGSTTDTGAQTVTYTANGSDANNVYFGGSTNVSIVLGSMSPPTAGNATISVGTAFSPASLISGTSGNGSGTVMWCVAGPTGWMPVSQTWAPTSSGTYTFFVGQMADANHTGNAQINTPNDFEVNGSGYSLFVNPIPQSSAVSISPSSTQNILTGQSITFSASGGSGTGAYVWGGAASGNGSSQTVTFNTVGTFTVSVYRQGDSTYYNSSTVSVTINVAAPTYALTVNNGSGGGNYVSGSSVGISANTFSGLAFAYWSQSGPGSLGNANASSTMFTTGAGNATLTPYYNDVQPPTTPGIPSISSVTQSSFVASWSASSDNVGVAGYTVFLNGSNIGNVGSTSVQINGLSADQTCTVQVLAYDAAGNQSGMSGSASVTTPDTTPPSVPPLVYTTNVSVTGFTLNWLPASDNIGVTGYQVFQDGVALGTTNGSTTTYNVTGLAAMSTHTFSVRATDAAGNWSALSSTISVTTNTPILVGIHAASYGTTSAQTFSVISSEASQSQTTSMAGAGASAWTTVHQYRGYAAGIDNDVYVTGNSYQREVRFEVPAGYTIYLNDQPYTNTATIDLGNANGANTASNHVKFAVVPADGSSALGAGYSIDPQISADDVIWAVSLGRDPGGLALGSLALRKADITGARFTLDALTITGPELAGAVEILPDGEYGGSWGYDRRFIYMPGACWLWLDDHVAGKPAGYCEIKAYDPGATPQWSSSLNTYVFNKSGSQIAPFAWYAVSSNDPTNDTVTITKNVGASNQLSWTLKKSVSGGTTTWLLQRAGQQTLRTVSTVSGSTRTDTVTLEDNLGTVVQTYQKVYQMYGWGSWELTSETADPAGLALTTSYTYGTSATASSYGKVLSVTKPDGTYVAYDYCTDDAAYGNLWHTYTPWLDVATTAATANANNAKVTTLTYVPVHYHLADALNSTTATVPVSNSPVTISQMVRNPDFASTTFNTHKVRKETIQNFSSAGASLTTTRLTYHPDETAAGLANQLISETEPNGTKVATIYYQGYFHDNGDSNTTVFNSVATSGTAAWGEYKFNGFSTQVTGSLLVNSWDSQPIDPIYLVPNRSTIELTVIMNSLGTHKITYVFTGSSGGVPTFEFLGRDSLTIASTPTTTTKTHFTHAGTQTVQTYTNGRLVTETANDGSTVTYNYDATGLLTSKVASGIGASGNYAAQGALYNYYTYDAAGNKLTDKLSSSSSASSPGPTTTYQYDKAGRLIAQTEPTGVQTTFAYNLAAHTTTTTLPGGATKIVTTYADGTLKSITGTAVVGEYHATTVNGDGTLTSTVYTLRTSDVNTPTAAPRWANSTADWLGRTMNAQTPGVGGTVSKVYTYNGKGELTLVQTLDVSSGAKLAADSYTDYNAYEMPFRTGVDLDGTADLQQTSALDRLTDTDSIFQKDSNGVWWLVTTTNAYNQASSSATILASTTKVRQNQFASAGTNVQADAISIDVFGNQSETKTAVDRTNVLITTTTVLPNSSVPAISVTRNGLLVSQQSSANLTTVNAYDGLRRLISASDPRIDGATTAANLPQRVGYYDNTAPVGSMYQKAWTRDTAGNQTNFTYSSSTGLLSSTQEPLVAGQSTSKFEYYAYTHRGTLCRQWGDVSYPVEYAFDDYGEKIAMRTFRMPTQSFTSATWPLSDSGADSMNPDPTQWSNGDKTTWSYDTTTGVLLNKTDAAGKQLAYTYTEAGLVKTKTWARGVSLTYKYFGDDAGDPLTRELKSVDYSDTTSINPDISYTYDRLGNLATVTDATGMRTFAYDTVTGSMNTETLPSFLGSRIITQKRDTTNTGTLGRDTGFSVGISGTPTSDYDVTYGYDSYGRAGSVTAGGVGFTYGYTAGSNLIGSVADTVSGWTLARTWVSNRNLLAQIATNMSTTVKSNFAYTSDEWGRRISVVRSGEIFGRYINGGLVSTWGYDDRSEVTGAKTFYGQSLSDQSYPVEGRNYAYSFDNVGNRLSSSIDGRTTTYDTNNLNQVTDRITPGSMDVAGMAPNGSTVQVNGQAPDRQGDYYHTVLPVNNTNSAVNQSVTVTSTSPSTSLTRKLFLAQNTLSSAAQWQYDADGNLTRDDQWSYTWNAENRLISMQTRTDLIGPVVAATDAKHLDFTYDYLGRRAEKIVRTGWNGSIFATVASDTRYIYHGWNLVAEYNALSSMAVIRNYTWGLDLAGAFESAGGVGGLLMTQDSGNQYVYAYDGNGNVSAVMNRSSGTTVAEYEYSPFGEAIRSSDSYAAINPFRFSTKYTDAETGLLYYGHRYYNPQTGNFLARDGIGEDGGLNLYGFCGNNGINTWDMLGNDPGGGYVPPPMPGGAPASFLPTWLSWYGTAELNAKHLGDIAAMAATAGTMVTRNGGQSDDEIANALGISTYGTDVLPTGYGGLPDDMQQDMYNVAQGITTPTTVAPPPGSPDGLENQQFHDIFGRDISSPQPTPQPSAPPPQTKSVDNTSSKTVDSAQQVIASIPDTQSTTGTKNSGTDSGTTLSTGSTNPTTTTDAANNSGESAVVANPTTSSPGAAPTPPSAPTSPAAITSPPNQTPTVTNDPTSSSVVPTQTITVYVMTDAAYGSDMLSTLLDYNYVLTAVSINYLATTTNSPNLYTVVPVGHLDPLPTPSPNTYFVTHGDAYATDGMLAATFHIGIQYSGTVEVPDGTGTMPQTKYNNSMYTDQIEKLYGPGHVYYCGQGGQGSQSPYDIAGKIVTPGNSNPQSGYPITNP